MPTFLLHPGNIEKETEQIITFIDAFDMKKSLLKNLYKHNLVVQVIACSVNSDSTLLGSVVIAAQLT
jgi:hypothetical protein